MRLELRPWREDDAAALHEAYRHSPDLNLQLGGADLATVDLARGHISEHLLCTESSRNWAVVADGSAVGNVGLAAIERRHGTAWVHYWLAAEARGYGHASRALAAVADDAFKDGLFRLELGHRVNNPASCAVALRAGFLREGLERQKLRYGPARYDVETHARLRTDPPPDLRPVRLLARVTPAARGNTPRT
ncbi:GNAT family N-acetyltransferase [Nesterenkonia sandarakina]|uniref:RimJ/RimL family protein N-acetyltransferase n=1 Tax=Nesterenkonia sandarakina TaxID=272918 RepID=A0A7Z0E9N0_9MICC|nr:GNAT family protein [Nesterenkonia sandarakina]NYJ17598.1 RimJ/RimL family protein N-acetyltransferase [Nesterenkonia sandarakina]